MLNETQAAAPAGRKKPPAAAAMAGRLRLLQAELADESPEARQQLLADEIERALRAIAPDDRPGFLKNLEALFPTWDARVDVSTEVKPSARSLTDERELRDPSFLVSRLVEVASALSAEQRRQVINRLQEGGLTPPNQGGLPSAATKLVREQLKLGDEAAIHAARTMELTALLAQMAGLLDPVVREAWKQIAPRSAVRRSGDLNKIMGKFALGDENVPRGQVQQELEVLRSLTAALIQAVGSVGKQFAQGFRKYAPTEIEGLARIEKKFTESLDAACWRKFKELASDLDEATIESTIRQLIATYAESCLGHRR
ncbi:MAG: hypothetical protein L0Y44_02470 [Phycisphaerales bacterium]|nr:hypothetical protein [Phycisphaerales bacterium]MCI0674730.1 hypothetical protein [Phycisphaerales bacterium]